jgi:membrane dipeptidase
MVSMFVFDAHCDTATAMKEAKKTLADFNGHITLDKLSKYDRIAQVFAIWLDNKYMNRPFGATLDAINYFKANINQSVKIVAGKNAILKNAGRGVISALLAAEGGEAIEGSFEKLRALHEAGLRLMTLTWNRANEIGDSSATPAAGGLTEFGKKIVRDMNFLNMAVDVSHLSDKGFWDVAACCDGPFVASHSNCRSVCNHRRNLTDEQIKAIGKSGGVIGINFYPHFLNESAKASSQDILRHADHIIKLAGSKAVGLGADFDGIDATPEDVPDAGYYSDLYYMFCAEYDAQIAGDILGNNFLRVFGDIIK